MRVNVGCGKTPTPGWENFDNSWTVRVASLPFVAEAFESIGIFDESQSRFAAVARRENVRYGNAAEGLPLPDNSVEVVYSSHMLEHLDRYLEVPKFLNETRRILREGGILRLVVPDLRKRAEEYLRTGDADQFVESTRLACERHRTLRARIKFLMIGHRHHLWMYDGDSLCRLLDETGFSDVTTVSPGETCISDPGALDLYERAEESVCVEAVNDA